MKIKNLLFVSLLVCIFVSCNQSIKIDSSKEFADAIYYGGDIITMETDTVQYAEAVAIKNGKIIFIGSKTGAEKYRGDSTVMNDLKGKTMMPGFIDPHLHPILGAIVLNTQFASPFDWNFPWGKMKAVRGHDAFIA